MVKITVNLSDEDDKFLKHITVEKDISSKATYIEKVVKMHLNDVRKAKEIEKTMSIETGNWSTI